MKKSNVDEAMCNCTWTFLSKNDAQFLSLVFFPFWEENFLVTRKENTWAHHLFTFLPTQSNTFQKSFPSYFLSKVFHPYSILPLNKHILKHSSLTNIQLLFDIYIFVHLCFHMIGYTQTHFSASLLSVFTCLDEIMILYSYSHMIDHMLRYHLHVLIFICSHACLLLP